MSQDDLVERIGKLEAELASLKRVESEQTPHPLEKVSKVAKFLLSYWTLFSFLFAVVVMVYVKYRFDIDYFENYRSAADIRNLSDFHRKMGDEFIGKTEWQAAEKAYREALDIDKNNIQAAYGLVKAQVFQPITGQKYYSPEVVNTRLNYLVDFFPNDYLLSYLRANYYVDKRNLDEARKWFEKSMQQNPQYSWNYVALGFLLQQEGNFDEAANNFKKALQLDAENYIANGNLGYTYLYEGKFDEALKYLQRGSDISPNFANYYGVADAYLYLKDFASALIYREANLKQLESKEADSERFLASNGLWMYNYMPLHSGDKDTIKKYVQSTGIDGQKALAYFSTSLDYALNNNFPRADELFKKGIEVDKDKFFYDFFVNKISSLQAFVAPSVEANQWLEARKTELLGGVK